MDLKVLGSGCANCKALEARALQALADLGEPASVEKVTDFGEIASYGVMSTPALVRDDVVILTGRVPSVEELRSLLARR